MLERLRLRRVMPRDGISCVYKHCAIDSKFSVAYHVL